MPAKSTTKEFVARARIVHGDRYDYSKVEYDGQSTKVIIICPKHGEFRQTPKAHLSGNNCRACLTMTTEDFIHKATQIHGNKYIYNKVEYRHSGSKIVIECRVHGEFQQLPYTHLCGLGCARCGKISMALKAVSTTDEFVSKSKAIHGNYYDYSRVKYTHTKHKVIIVCPKHGEFRQTPHGHLTGYGCRSCGIENMSSKVRNTTDDFVQKSIKIHGDKYDYSKSRYTHSRGKVIIVCKKHGEFTQEAGIHLRGSNCPRCAGTVTRDSTEFINLAKSVHGNKYIYEKVQYQTSGTKVIIVCKKHGDFEQNPTQHLSGRGCPMCGIESVSNFKRMSQNDFIHRANNIHQNKYDYDKVQYVSCLNNVVITCKIHGDFEQKPTQHLQGSGCRQCAIARMDTDDFITKAIKIHGAKYDYSKTNYKRGNLYVTITCRQHGDFEQKPRGHLSGYGCIKCAGHHRGDTKEFITKAIGVHGNLYDYDKVLYQKSNIKVIITCKKHGDFNQRPNDHLMGGGCPKCNASKGECAIRIWLEKRNCKFKEQAKFQSCKNVNPLPFDFEVSTPERTLIEFHGQQHYEPMSFSNSRKDTQEQMEANLARVQHNDAIKAKWCEDNNVPLLVIPYWDKHRIPELLEEFLGSASLVVAT